MIQFISRTPTPGFSCWLKRSGQFMNGPDKTLRRRHLVGFKKVGDDLEGTKQKAPDGSGALENSGRCLDWQQAR